MANGVWQRLQVANVCAAVMRITRRRHPSGGAHGPFEPVARLSLSAHWRTTPAPPASPDDRRPLVLYVLALLAPALGVIVFDRWLRRRR